MAYQLLVNGNDYTKYLEQTTWTITQQYSRQGDTATFYLKDEHPSSTEGGVALNVTVPPLAVVSLTDLSINQILFSGMATMPEMQYVGPNLVSWEVQCTDWTYLADHALVVGDFINMTADQIVIALAAQANCGVIATASSAGGFVFPGPLIPRIQLIYSTLSNALTSLIQVASTYTSYGWYVDEGRNLHFTPLASAVNSGVLFTDAAIQASGVTTSNYDADNYTYIWDATQLRNRAVVSGSTYDVPQTDTWIGDGTTMQWVMSQVPDTSVITSAVLKIAGVTTQVSSQQGTSATTPFVFTQSASGAWTLAVNASGGGTIPTAGQSIVVTYKFTTPVIAQVDDTASETALNYLPNLGIFSTYISDSNLQTLSACQQRGQAEVYAFGLPEERVQFWSTEQFAGHVRAGQVFTWTSQYTPNSANSYLPGLTDTYLAIQNTISASGNGGNYRVYQLTGARTSGSVGI